MNIQIDNYYVSVDKYGYISICVEGQKIIHDQVRNTSREGVIAYAVKAINDYNKRHNLEWGNVDR